MVTVVTKTIGPTGRDYTTFTLAEAAVESIATAEFGSTDLVANDGAIVFEADAATYSESGTVYILSSLTTDATRQVTYKPASDAEHGGSESAGVIVQPSTGATPFDVRDNFTALDGLVLKGTSVSANGVQTGSGTAEGVLVQNLLIVAGAYPLTLYGGGSASDPICVKNCVARTTGNVSAVRALGLSRALYVDLINCTIRDGQTSVEVNAHTHDATVRLVNVLALNPSTNTYVAGIGAGTLTVTGSNNFGGSSGAFPAALQGSPYPITATTSFSTPLGSGDYAVYMGSNGSLANVTGNDVWQQGVGPGTNSDVPTTDINGVARSGASCNPGAFEADGFVAPTVLTRTIGPTGRDYATFTLAESAVTSIGTGTDLTFENEAIVFEADAADYSETLSFDTSGGLTCDATRNVTWTHATGAGHGGAFESGVNLVGGCSMREDHAVVDGLSVSPTSGGAAGIFGAPEGVFLRNMMVYSTNSYAIRLDRGATAAFPGVVENCVAKSDTSAPFDIRSEGSGLDAHWRVVNCTAMATGIKQGFHVGLSSSDTLHLNLVNNNVNGGTVRSYFAFAGPTFVVTGSNNFGPDDGSSPFPAALQGSPYPITATTSFSTPLGSGDYAVYMGSNGSLANVTGNDVWQQGVGPGTNSDVPTTDINGVARSGATCNPGAFEADGFVAPTVITKTIGPSGRDYTTFSLAEAAVTSIGTGTDLTFYNEAIVFEADAGTYVEILNVDSTLVSDATRNITYQCADRAARPVIGNGTQSTTVRMRDDFTHFDGIDSFDTSGGAFKLFDSQVGLVIENCEATSDGSGVYLNKSGANIGSAAAPCVIRNVVTKARFGVNASGADLFVEVFNCTFLPGTTSPAGQVNYQFFATGSSACKLFNCIVLDSRADRQFQATATVTGSNNVGVSGGNSSFFFSTAGIGSEKTPTTSFSTPLGAGDYSVFMGATGALADVTGNDVWQQGVGPGSNSDVPTTDINGVARSGASCNPGAFEADGFVAPTVITKTVGTASRDYASLALAEADVENIGSSGADLTHSNERIEFVCYADSDFGNVSIISDIVADPTRYVWWKAAPGESPRIYSAGYVDIPVQDSFTRWSGINAYSNSIIHRGWWIGNNATHPTVEGMIFEDCEHETNGAIGGSMLQIRNNYAPGSIGTELFPITYRNLVCKVQTFTAGGGGANLPSFERFLNCTFVGRGVGSNAFNTARGSGVTADLYEIVNCIILEPNSSDCNIGGGGKNVQGSNNIGNAGAPSSAFTFAHFGIGAQYTLSTAYDPGAGNFALYVGKNGALLDSPHNDVIGSGVGPASNSDVPTTDILGDTRSGTTTNPGAFALAQATAVLTRTIGPVGRDYATFTAAEADVENIGGSADLVFENERIEFLADAGTYPEYLTISSSLTTDATRQVTYKPSAGSEHGGVPGQGARIQFGNLSLSSWCIAANDPFTAVKGLEFDWTDSGSTGRSAETQNNIEGVTFSDCIIRSAGTGVLFSSVQPNTSDTQSFPVQVSNCVLDGTSATGFRLWNYGASDKAWTVTNCTIRCSGRAFDIFSSTNDSTYTITNNLILSAAEDWRDQGGGGTSTVLGSNNFGPQTSATHVFPAALQGSPYPITATTNTTPGFGDYAIYNASTGALVVVDDNAALGGGVGPAANSDVPVFDINGVKRIGGGCDPGAFEGVRSRSLDVWDVVTATHNTPGTFGNLVQSLPATIADTVPSAAEIAAAVWNKLIADHQGAGSFGELVQDIPGAVPSAEESATAVWNKLAADHQAAGSFGELSQQTHIAANRAGSQRLE